MHIVPERANTELPFCTNLQILLWSLLAAVLICTPQLVTAQTLSWSSPVEYSPIQVGGQLNGLGGVGTANWNGMMWVAYADNSLNGKLWLTHTTDGVTFAPPVQVAVSAGSGQTVYTADNPSLAVFNGNLYIGYIDNYGEASFVKTTDGVNFGTNIAGFCSESATDSPSLAVFNNQLYFAFRTTSATLGLCVINSDNSTTTQTYSQFSLGDSPALGVFGNTFYVAFRNTSSNHYIYLAESTDGSNFTLSTAATGSHTSTACSIAVFNNVLYIGFRQNSSNNDFFYTYSTNGTTFSSPIQVPWTMGGPPSLVLFNGYLYNAFRQNDSGHYLFTAFAY